MLKKITYNEYREYSISMDQIHFMHSDSWAKLRNEMAWEYEYIGFYINNELKGAFLAQFKKLPKVKYKMLYIARGMIIDYLNEEYLTLFTKEIKEYAKENKAYVVKIDPELKRYDVDVNGNPLSEQTKAYDYLVGAGFKHLGFVNNFEGINGRHTFIVDYKDKTIDDLFKKLKSNDRTKIKKAQSLGVFVEEVGRVEELYEMMKITGQRGGYEVRSLEFLKLILDNFKDDVTILVSKLNLNKHINILLEKRKELNNKIDILKNKDINELNEKQAKKLNNQLNDLNTKLSSLDKDYEYATEYQKNTNKDVVTLSSALYVFDNKQAWYWYGGSNNDFRHLRPVNLQMWKFIELSYNKGCESFDLLGTGGELNPENKNYGLYKFKKSFGGEFVEYIGEFDLPINIFIYNLTKFILPKMQTSKNSFILRLLRKMIK